LASEKNYILVQNKQIYSEKRVLEEQFKNFSAETQNKNDDLEDKLMIIAENVHAITKAKDELLEENTVLEKEKQEMLKQIAVISSQKNIVVDMKQLLQPTAVDDWIQELQQKQRQLLQDQDSMMKQFANVFLPSGYSDHLLAINNADLEAHNIVLSNEILATKSQLNSLEVANMEMRSELEEARLKNEYSRRCIVIECIELHEHVTAS